MGSTEIDLSLYDKVVISSIQSQAFYDTLEANRVWFENYVSGGGVLNLHVAVQSSVAQGAILPGGLVLNYSLSNDVNVLTPGHELLTIPNTINESDLDGWNMSAHGFFTSIPAAATEILQPAGSGQPCTVEIPLGAGWIVATTQPVEYAGSSPLFLQNLLTYEHLTDYVPADFVHVVDVGHLPYSTFPTITAKVVVATDAGRDCGLTLSDFKLTEDGFQQPIKSVACGTGSPEAIADVVVVFDVSSSMLPHRDALHAQALSFASEISAAGVDARFGLVSFEAVPTLELALTNDAAAFEDALGSLALSGNTEFTLDALVFALSAMTFRPDAQKYFLVVTDEDIDLNLNLTMQEVIDAYNGEDATLFAASTALPEVPENDARLIAEATGGFWIDITNADFTIVSDAIVSFVSSIWTVTYGTLNDVADDTVREVRITVDDPVEGFGFDTDFYLANSMPVLTGDFRDMDNNNDGRISRLESGLSIAVFGTQDINGNGFIELWEILERSIGLTGVTSPVWVDFNYSGTELGSQAAPFDTLDEAVAFVAEGGEVRVAPGSTLQTQVGSYEIEKPVQVTAPSGAVTIGGAAPAREPEQVFWRRIWEALTE